MIIESIILGLMQGLTEFLPISSTGHLVLARKFLGVEPNLTYDVLLNIGTLMALVLFQYQNIKIDAKKVLANPKSWNNPIYLAVLLSLPTFVIGYLLKDTVEKWNENIEVTIVMLFTVGLIMTQFKRIKNLFNNKQPICIKSTIPVAIAQIVALIPGTSRSGVTIMTGRLAGLNSADAIKFSFYLGLITITGATTYTLIFKEGLGYLGENMSSLLIGNISSFIGGVVAIKILLNVVKSDNFKLFGMYRVALSVLLGLLLITNII